MVGRRVSCLMAGYWVSQTVQIVCIVEAKSAGLGAVEKIPSASHRGLCESEPGGVGDKIRIAGRGATCNSQMMFTALYSEESAASYCMALVKLYVWITYEI